MLGSIEIQTLDKDNLPDLAHLMVALWPELSFTEAFKDCENKLRSDSEITFLSKTWEGSYVGFVTISIRFEHVEGTHSSPVGYLEGIYVKPEMRQQGVARKLFLNAEEWCKKKGCHEMGSDATLDNLVSHRFHFKAGFQEVNRLVCYRKEL
ncbi:MAG: GNAT family N-acetyltransferase [Saprospiraceae bacterium]|nr:GNAT family N-acetyltransferase [Saprospiraceae bacterium]